MRFPPCLTAGSWGTGDGDCPTSLDTEGISLLAESCDDGELSTFDLCELEEGRAGAWREAVPVLLGLVLRLFKKPARQAECQKGRKKCTSNGDPRHIKFSPCHVWNLHSEIERILM